MSSDERMRQLFDQVEFRDEPPMASFADDDAKRGRSHLRRRRAAGWTAGVAGLAAAATGVAIAIPDTPAQHVTPEVAGSVSKESSSVVQDPEPPRESHIDSFAETRQLLLDTAVEHLDPEHAHLPDESTNTGSGGGAHGWRVSTKLAWTVPGESGMGMVQVFVTTPGFADGEHAAQDAGFLIGCHNLDECAEQTVPGTGETVLVADPDPEMNLLYGVMYERADGSFTGVGVYDLFGNNSTEPVSDVAVELEQVFAFVVDPALRVDPAEAAEHSAVEDHERLEREAAESALAEELDFSSTENVPAPDVEDMSLAQATAALDACIAHTEDWEGFEAVFGLRADVDTPEFAAAGWVIAERGEQKMLCEIDSSDRSAGAMLFGAAEVKDSPHLIAPVEAKSASTFGLYTSDVARITVQPTGGPEEDAIMRDGYWFAPIRGGGDAEDRSWSTSPNQVALRAYDADDELIYDSTADDAECYTDPDGTEIVRPGSSEDMSVEDCQPMLVWEH